MVNRYLLLSRFIGHHYVGSRIYLNPDVEYFLRQISGVIDPEDEEFRNVDHLIPKLSKDCIAFLDDAVKRVDYGAVVDTTASCRPREEN